MRGWDAASQNVRSGITKEILKEAGFKSKKELMDFVSQYRMDRQQPPAAPAPNGQQTPQNQLTPEVQLALKEAEEIKEKYAQQVAINKQQALTAAARNAFLTAGGRPNSDAYKTAEDDAINLMLAEGILSIDDDMKIVTRSGLPVEKTVAMWLDSKPVYKKPAGTTPGAPIPPSPGAAGNSSQSNETQDDRLKKWLATH